MERIGGFPNILMITAFLGMGYTWIVLVGKERSCGSWMASTVPHKGGEGTFLADKCLEHVSESGDQAGKIIVKVDQERSMAYLLEQLVDMKEEGRTILEESPSQSKGSLWVRRGNQEYALGVEIELVDT